MRSLITTCFRLFWKENRAYFHMKCLGITIFFIFVYTLYCSTITDITTQNNLIHQNSHLLSHRGQPNHFMYYPASRCFEEMQQTQLYSFSSVNLTESLWSHSYKYDFPSSDALPVKRSIIRNELLPFSKRLFQHVDFPVLWLDFFGDVHWNEAAEREMYVYLIQKQFPPLEKAPTLEDLTDSYIQDCQLRQLLILEQWRDGGFLSRLNCLIEQFGQSLYTPTMALLGPRQLLISGAGEEDFLEEGILGYTSPISRCSAYFHHLAMSQTKEAIYKIVSDIPQQTKFLRISTFQHLRKRSNFPFLYLPDIWKFGYEHVPHRRWLFDFDRKRAVDFVSYGSSKNTLIQHKEEHIYHAPSIEFNLSTWQPNNIPFYPSKEDLQSDYPVTWKDKVFTSFIRYMITLYVHQFSPRIQLSTKLLTLHWTKYLGDKNRQPYNSTLNEMAGIFIRRGDKMLEDSFWQKHQCWRNISYYVKGLVDEEKARNKTFSSIFIMTDDASVMNSILEYASTKSNFSEETYARRFLYGRQILYNVFAPQSCFNPFIRIGFDQFLVNVNFLVQHALFIVSHNDSNVGRYFERLIYAKRQIKGNKTFRTADFVKNAPNSFD